MMHGQKNIKLAYGDHHAKCEYVKIPV